MAQRKTTRLDEPSAQAIAQRARRAKELTTISDLADQNLNPTDGWRTILPEHLEAIKTRLIGGDTLSNVCRAMGINEQSATRYFHENKEALVEFLDWKSFGSHRLWDRLIDMIDNKDMTSKDKDFAYKVINSYTGKINRTVYGDNMNLHQTGNITIVAPKWIQGAPISEQVIDTDFTEDPDSEE